VLQQPGRRRRLEQLPGGHGLPGRDDADLRGDRRLHGGNGLLRGRGPDVPAAVGMRHAGKSRDLRHECGLRACFSCLPQHDMPGGPRRGSAARGRWGSDRCGHGRLTRRTDCRTRTALHSRCPCRRALRRGHSTPSPLPGHRLPMPERILTHCWLSRSAAAIAGSGQISPSRRDRVPPRVNETAIVGERPNGRERCMVPEWLDDRRSRLVPGVPRAHGL
jgi:hypothetical protein